MQPARIKWELVAALSGVVISLSSLWFTYRQTQLSERHDRVSVQPRLTLNFHADSKRDRYGWYLSNNGLGPAYFTGFRLYVDDAPVKSSALGGWVEALQKLGLKLPCWSTAWTPPDSALSNGPEVDEPLLRLKTPVSPECELEFAKLVINMSRLKVQIDYQSIYGEPFRKTAQPTRLL